jgi:hypothetical protein
MSRKKSRAADRLGEAIASIEDVAAEVSLSARKGLKKAVSAVASSDAANRLEKRTRPTRRAITKEIGIVKSATKKRVGKAAKKTSLATTAAKGRTEGASKTGGVAKAAATKKATTTKKAAATKVSAAKKAAKKAGVATKVSAAKKATKKKSPAT